MIELSLKGQKLAVHTPLVVAGTVDYLTVQIYRDSPEWKDLKLHVFFQHDNLTYEILTDGDFIGTDAHLNLMDGEWSVSVVGYEFDGDTMVEKVTTNTIGFTVAPAPPDAGESLPYTPPSAYEQIEAIARSVREDADNGLFNGAKGDPGDQGPVGPVAAFSMGTVTTLAAGSDATATITGTDAAPVLNLGIPKGDQGDQGEQGTPGADGQDGASITVSSNVIEYQEGTSGTTAPVGPWSQSVPTVTAGNYLWTRVTTTFSDGAQAVSYSVSRMGIDGSGSVVSVCNVSPDGNGNVALTASDVGAKPASYSAPVDSVNGQTGAVVLTAADVGAKPSTYSAPVDSVNSKTGAVVLTASDVNALPDSYQPPVTSVNEKTGTVYLDNKDVNAPYGKSVSATLSSAGWYRLVKVNAGAVRSFTNGYRSAVVTIKLMTSRGANNTTEEHEIKLFSGSHAYPFTGEISVSSTLWIDKIRFNFNVTDDIQYVDIHFIGTSAANVTGCFTVDVDPEAQQYYTAETLQSVADAPTGESVLTIYEFAENTLQFNSVSLPATIAAQTNVTLATIPVPAGRTGVFITIQFRSANPITKLLVNFGRNIIGTLNNGDYQAATIFYPLSGESSLTLTCYNYDSNAITMQGSNNYIYYRFV